MRAVVIYESLTGNTARAAHLVAESARAAGVEASVYDITNIGLKDLAEADIVIDGKRAACFMTYAIHAGKALSKLERVVEERGGTVVASTLLRRDRLDVGVADFVHDALATVPA